MESEIRQKGRLFELVYVNVDQIDLPMAMNSAVWPSLRNYCSEPIDDVRQIEAQNYGKLTISWDNSI